MTARVVALTPPPDATQASRGIHRRCRRCGGLRMLEALYIAWSRYDGEAGMLYTYTCRDRPTCNKAVKWAERKGLT